MSKQDVEQSSTKQRRSRKTNTANQQNGKQAPVAQRPANDAIEAWKAYWEAQNQPWRTEPEIDAERQKYLAERRCTKPDIGQGIYPFKDIKLSRADVEWLLATHESKGIRGPVDWNDESQREREGLDLRGANLRRVDLRVLPLACLYGGFYHSEWDEFEEWLEEAEVYGKAAAIHMEEANLQSTHLEGVNFGFAHLENANLMDAHLERAFLCGTHLEGATLQGVHLEDASLIDAHLEHTFFNFAHLEGANLSGAHLENGLLQRAYLNRAALRYAHLKGAEFYEDHMEGADLEGAHLEDASLLRAHLEGANLSEAHLEGTDIRYAHLEGCILCRAFFDNKTKLDNIVYSNQHTSALLADIRWGEVNLAVIDWGHVKTLGDELLAHQTKGINEYRTAVRANRQLAVVLRDQGLNEEADHFAYRSQLLQRRVWQLQKRPLKLLLSWFLYLLAGYGYRPLRSLIAYLVIIFGFMGLYLLNAHFVAPHLRWDEALVLSISSFHGRGFFTQNVTLGDTYARLAAIEAIVGLFIEISFIATFTQRFFGK